MNSNKLALRTQQSPQHSSEEASKGKRSITGAQRPGACERSQPEYVYDYDGDYSASSSVKSDDLNDVEFTVCDELNPSASDHDGSQQGGSATLSTQVLAQTMNSSGRTDHHTGWETLDDDILLRRSSRGSENVDDECRRLKEKRTEITNEIERCRAELNNLAQELAVSRSIAFPTDQNKMVTEMQNKSNDVQREYYGPSCQSRTAESVDQNIQPRRSRSDKSVNLKLSSFRKVGINSVLNSLKPRSQLLRWWQAAKVHHLKMHLNYMVCSIAPDSMIIPAQKFNTMQTTT